MKASTSSSGRRCCQQETSCLNEHWDMGKCRADGNRPVSVLVTKSTELSFSVNACVSPPDPHLDLAAVMSISPASLPNWTAKS